MEERRLKFCHLVDLWHLHATGDRCQGLRSHLRTPHPTVAGELMTKAQIQFTRQQVEQLDELRRQTGASRTELVRRAVDYFIRGIREHGVHNALLPLQESDTREAR